MKGFNPMNGLSIAVLLMTAIAVPGHIHTVDPVSSAQNDCETSPLLQLKRQEGQSEVQTAGAEVTDPQQAGQGKQSLSMVHGRLQSHVCEFQREMF